MKSTVRIANTTSAITVPTYRTFAGKKYRYSLLNPGDRTLSKAEADQRAEMGRSAGWSVRKVEQFIPFYQKVFDRNGGYTYTPKCGYVLYDRKNRKTRDPGAHLIRSDIPEWNGRKIDANPNDYWFPSKDKKR